MLFCCNIKLVGPELDMTWPWRNVPLLLDLRLSFKNVVINCAVSDSYYSWFFYDIIISNWIIIWRRIFVCKRLKSFNKDHCLYGVLGHKAFSKPVKRKPRWRWKIWHLPPTFGMRVRDLHLDRRWTRFGTRPQLTRARVWTAFEFTRSG